MRKMYSKNQIEQIAKASVSSGTKLYKHSLSGTGNPITIIDTQSTTITSSNISTRARECIRAYTADGSTIIAVSGIADGIYYSVLSGSQIGGNSISNITNDDVIGL